MWLAGRGSRTWNSPGIRVSWVELWGSARNPRIQHWDRPWVTGSGIYNSGVDWSAHCIGELMGHWVSGQLSLISWISSRPGNLCSRVTPGAR